MTATAAGHLMRVTMCASGGDTCCVCVGAARRQCQRTATIMMATARVAAVAVRPLSIVWVLDCVLRSAGATAPFIEVVDEISNNASLHGLQPVNARQLVRCQRWHGERTQRQGHIRPAQAKA